MPVPSLLRRTAEAIVDQHTATWDALPQRHLPQHAEVIANTLEPPSPRPAAPDAETLLLGEAPQTWTP